MNPLTNTIRHAGLVPASTHPRDHRALRLRHRGVWARLCPPDTSLACRGQANAQTRTESGLTKAENGSVPIRRSAEHGFTLVELMVVIVIIGLLATIVVINVLPLGD